MRFATMLLVVGTLLLIGIPAQAENTGVPVGSSRLIVDLDYSDTFTGTEVGGIASRDWGVFPVPADGLAVEDLYGNPQVQWPEGHWSINSDDNALDGATLYPGGSGAGSETGMTQSGGSGSDWSITYGLREDFVVQVDAVQCGDRFEIWTSASDSFFDSQALSVFFRGSDNTGPYSPIGLFHNGEYDSGLTPTAPIGEWHNFAVHFMLDQKKIEVFTDEVSLGVVDLTQVLPDTDISNAMVGIGWWGGGSDRLWTDNFQIGSRVSATKASRPEPVDRQEDVLRDTVLGWTPGGLATGHDVYFGTDLDDVTNADRTNPLGVLASQGQTATTYDPGRLDFGQTYYWRIDEVTAGAIVKGNVWSFTVEPYSMPVEAVQATASSQTSDASGPGTTVDGSGLDDADQHSTEDGTMWFTAFGDTDPWIQYEFEQVTKLDKMLVWNSNTTTELTSGFGVKDVIIEVSEDGATWTQLEDVSPFAQASGQDGYEANTVVDFGGVAAKIVKINIESNQLGLLQVYGLSEVRFYAIPTYPREPQPEDGELVEGVNIALTWRAGREAGGHEVYLGTDAEDLTLVDTVSENACAPSGLLYGTTYYWSVIEVNDAETPASYAGPVWSFTTSSYGVVDDFETYDDDVEAGTTIWQSWHDGYENSALYGGSQVGYDQAPFAEKTVVYSGMQSMPLSYDNTSLGKSEAKLLLDGQDWTASGILTLSLVFQGIPGNTGQLYVKINDTKVTYDGDAVDIARPQWQAWNIDLSAVNTNLQSVTSLTVGVDGAAASGDLIIDTIRLYPQVGELVEPIEPDTTGLVMHFEFEGTTNDSSGQGHHGTPLDNPAFVPGVEGQAIDLNGWSQTVSIPHSAAIKPENEITFSAWVKADDITFNQYSEIYRKEDGANRHLLSFQEFGTILSLGMGIGGSYAELDAIINPDNFTDGQWHLITATYDGSYKRVYADGGLLGRAVATGPIMTDGTADAYIGSWDNLGEFLDGQIDDFRLYSRALSLGEILWLAGRTAPVHKPF